MPNEYFAHISNHDPEDNKNYEAVLSILKKLKKENNFIVTRPTLEGSYPECVCYPGVDFTPWMEMGLDDPKKLMDYTFLGSVKSVKLKNLSSFFRKKDGGYPVSREEWNAQSSENQKKRRNVYPVMVNTMDGETLLMLTNGNKFYSPKENFNGEPIFPKISEAITTTKLPI